ncbi:MAG: DUF2231 domain-containing protein [Janthinobacterium lividum]
MGRMIDALIGRIETADGLDRPGYAIGKAIARTTQLAGRPAKGVGNTLHGRPLGHPLHPLVVAVPIGTWTLALGLDLLAAAGLLRDRGSARAADLALGAGAIGAVGALATGLADWQHLNGRDRRVGLVHGSVNTASLALVMASIALRRRGRRAVGIGASAAAYAVMGVGGYLGGHLVYRRRAGVDHADRSPEPRDFRRVASLSELADNVPHRAAVWDEVARREIGIVLVRQGARVHAMGARCSHAGGPLDQGWVLDGTLVCPWHGSRYVLETGQPAAGGPSTCPQPRYEVRVDGDSVELRREQEPGDDVVTEAKLARLRATPGTGGWLRPVGTPQPPAPRPSASPLSAPHEAPPGPPRSATEVLFEHHQLIRQLFERTLATPGEDPRRHELMRILASELDIHEAVEDAIFYPAVQPVSEDVDVAYAEHGVLADLLAATVKLPTASAAFGEHLLALQSAFLHHAGSEERSMFVEAGRLSDARLAELGHQLDTMLDEERTSRFRHAFRALKISLLEGL